MSAKDGFYSKKSALGVPNALVLLMLVFFFVPFAFRGARMALQKTENNVKDWLPSDFRETEELAWFAKRFVSEQFIVATWEGCHEGDQRLKMFVSKLRSELEPGPDADRSSEYFEAREVGKTYALFAGADYHFNWGGLNEKWLVSGSGRHFYITPNGRLYRWNGNSNMVSGAGRALTRAIGSFELEGQFVAKLGDAGTDGAPNPFWENPRLLTAPLFKSIETGPDLVKQLSDENGSLHVPTNPKAGERLAISRLTGSMFGPPVPRDFDWTNKGLATLLGDDYASKLPEGWQDVWDFVVEDAVKERKLDSALGLQKLDPVDQSEIWYTFFDNVHVVEPSRQTCVILTLTEVARENLGKVLARGMLGQTQGRVFQLSEECGISAPPIPNMAPPPFSMLAAAPEVAEPAIHVGGPPVDNVAIDEEGTITLVRLIGYSLVLGLVLSWILLRSTRLMMMVFFVGGVSAMASLGMVWWSNASVDAILLTMPSLVYVLGMAGAIHIVNYYRDATVEGGQKGAPERAITHAVMPCTLAAFTTAIGLLSLCSSNILPIRKFGIFSAMGVMATLVLLYIYLPSALTIFPPKVKAVKDAGSKSAQGILNFWEAVGAFILKRHWFVNAACLIAFVGLGMGLMRIKTSVQLLKLFDGESQIIEDYGWLEQNFGRLVPMELVVRFPKSLLQPLEIPEGATDEEARKMQTQLSLVERAEVVGRIEKALQDEFGYAGKDYVGQGMSPVTLLPTIPSNSVARSGANRVVYQKFDRLLETDYLSIEEHESNADAELWRISLRLGALNDVDYGEFVSELRAVVEPIVAAYRLRKEVYDKIVAADAVTTAGKPTGLVLFLGRGQSTASDEEAEIAAEVDLEQETYANALDGAFQSEFTKPIWHNPERAPFGPERAISDEWAAALKRFKYIVVFDDHDNYDMDFIKAANPNIIDARPFLTDALNSHAAETVLAQNVEQSTFAGTMDVVYTGVVPVVYKAQRTLLISLIESVAWAFVLIAIVMTCLLSPARSFASALHPANFFRGMGSGALSMIPNVFPVVMIFGFIGWSEQLLGQAILVDIGTMMTASVAMGVAVDDTIHFLTWFREGLKRGLDRRDAIFVAYKHVAPAMTQTTIIAGLGLSVFALSTFTPTQRFGTLMLALLGAALVGDLIFLPALLASPLGRIFTMRPKKLSGHPGASDSSNVASDDNNGEYRLAALEEEMAPKVIPGISEPDGDSPQEEVAENDAKDAPHLKINRPQMMREDPQKVRRRN